MLLPLVSLSFALLFDCVISNQPLNIRAHPRRSVCTSNGLCNSGTTAVQWDSESLIVQGRRTIIWSGEFHFWRLPVPDLWRDILQKFKAAGLNTVSTYVHWGATNPSEGRVEWEGYRDFELFIKVAQEVGLWVIARPGPYINGESTAGGIPGRVTNIDGFLRSNDSDYFASYQDYYRSAVEIVKRHQIQEGGPVILFQVENEYTNNTNFATPNPVSKNEYMQALEDILHELGILLPLTSNDSYMGRNFAPGAGSDVGAVDIYAMDSYPQGGCNTPLQWSGFPVDYWDYHESVNPGQPWFLPEFQGGSFLGWGPGSPTYEDCNVLTGSDFEQVYYLNQFATGVRLQNIYMTYGGTSWGFFAFPGVYTSYDYGASIAENRTLTGKWFELKNLGMFIRSVENDLVRAVNMSNISDVTKPPPGYSDDPSLFVTELRNPQNDAGFYIVRHLQTSSFVKTDSKIHIATSAGKLTVPQASNISFTLDGRQSRVILTDHSYGNSSILYTTASLFFSGKIGARDVAVLHGPAGQSFEVAVLGHPEDLHFDGSLQVNLQADPNDANHTILTFSPGQGDMAISITDNAIFILGDTSSMEAIHSPIVPDENGSTIFGLDSNETVLVIGPHLVRNATVDSTASSLSLFGDVVSSIPTSVTVFAPESVTEVTWNGVTADSTAVAPGVLRLEMFEVADFPKTPTTPQLSAWKYADSLPEIQEGYDDSQWTVADRVNSTNPFFKYYGKNYLYACEYGFCEGPVLWRGHFSSDGTESAVNLSITGGRAFAGSVWLNSAFLGSTFGNSSNNQASAIIETTNKTYVFPDGVLFAGKENIITVLHDNMGMEEAQANQFSEWLKTPRGIQGYSLPNSTTEIKWKVQGKLGGFSDFPDRVRGIMNEGGTFGERAGWHLPGFDSSSWETRSPQQGISSAGVGFFRTTFELEVKDRLDVMMSFNFPPYGNGTYRAFLYVNGWNMGRYVANLGPQNKFPVPEGILNYSGTNTVAIVLWATAATGAQIQSFTLAIDNMVVGGVGAVQKNNPEWEARDAF